MQKLLSVVLLILLIIATLTGCQTKSPEVSVKNTIDTGVQTYCERSDGTWQCDGRSYQYRLEISGRTPQAAVDSTFVYLSNLEEIPFEQAWKAAGFSSSSDDYFSPEDAVLVEWRTESSTPFAEQEKQAQPTAAPVLFLSFIIPSFPDWPSRTNGPTADAPLWLRRHRSSRWTRQLPVLRRYAPC